MSGTIKFALGASLLAVALTGQAQSGGEAASLVQDVASRAMAAKSWSAAGTLVTRAADGKDQPAVKFRISYQLPRYARLEMEGGIDFPFTRVCEGTTQWTYYPDLKGFVRVLLPQIGPCAFPLNAWAPMGVTLQFPVLGGTDVITVDGHPQPCQIVRGSFTWPGRDAAVKESVTLCIDREHHRILRYHLQHSSPGPASSQTYTFSSLQQDMELPASLFDFQAPAGSHAFATIDWLTPIPSASPGVRQVSDAISAPILTEMAPPITPGEAALLEGGNTVALHIDIGPDGLPHNIQVSRSLGHGLDEAAIQCVKHWRFQPGMSTSGQVAVVGTVFVHFMDSVTR